MSWLPKSFHDRQTGHAIISIIHLAECLNVNPWCIRIKTAVGDCVLDDGLGVMLFHDAVWVYMALLPHHCLGPMWVQFAGV